MDRCLYSTLLFAFIFILLSSTVYAGGDKEYTITAGGMTRTYWVHFPPNYNHEKRLPVVLIFHGGGGSAQEMMQVTRMDETSDKYNFLAVYPQGTGRRVFGKILGTWNTGKCCSYAMQHHIDDVAFVSILIDKLEKDFHVDPARIYATGHSNGGMMSYLLACNLSNKIAAVAPVAGQMEFDECSPSRPVPVIDLHGTADPCLPFNGGMSGGCFSEFVNKLLGTNIKPRNIFQAQSVQNVINEWIARNGVSGNPQVIYQHGAALCKSWGKGTSGEVVLCTINGMGHTWPGGTYGAICRDPDSRACKLYKETVGPLSDDLNANEMIWQFFQGHPLKLK